MISIQYPIWKTRSVGIAEYKLGTLNTDIEILYVDKFGRRLYPHIYRISTPKARKYPVQLVKGLRIRIVPISDLEIIGDVREPESSLSAAVGA